MSTSHMHHRDDPVICQLNRILLRVSTRRDGNRLADYAARGELMIVMETVDERNRNIDRRLQRQEEKP